MYYTISAIKFEKKHQYGGKLILLVIIIMLLEISELGACQWDSARQCE